MPLKFSGVTLFHKGSPRGLPYTEEDFDDIVENWRDFGAGEEPIARIPLAVGHEEADFRRTDLPSLGHAGDVWHDGQTLFADIVEVDPDFARAAKKKRFYSVSPEIYNSIPDLPRPAMMAALDRRGKDAEDCLATAMEIAKQQKREMELDGDTITDLQFDALVDRALSKFLGKALRRISALGAEPPQQKGKGELPDVETYRERHPQFFPATNSWQVFSEPQQLGDVDDYYTQEAAPMDEVAAACQSFSERFPQYGNSDFLARGFAAMREVNPHATAEDFFGQ